jgi:hypothetical protein
MLSKTIYDVTNIATRKPVFLNPKTVPFLLLHKTSENLKVLTSNTDY